MLCLKRQEKEQLKEIADALPKIVEEMMPDIPEVPEVTGGTIPPMTRTSCKMKKLLAVIAAAFLSAPALAEPTKGYRTMDAMGCMLLRECTDGVTKVTNLLDISSKYPNTDDFYPISVEFNIMLFP